MRRGPRTPNLKIYTGLMDGLVQKGMPTKVAFMFLLVDITFTTADSIMLATKRGIPPARINSIYTFHLTVPVAFLS